MATESSFQWTNSSVKKLAGADDPIAVIEGRAQSVALEAMDHGWSGPPFDPIRLADILKISVTANADIRDARTLSERSGKFLIEFNPNRPRARVRFSIAHEIAHTLFPDCGEATRNRAHLEAATSDGWQLELLCNIAASEFLMPIGSFRELSKQSIDINNLMILRKEYDVSTEAILLRATKLSKQPVTMFVASRLVDNEGTVNFRIDYSVSSSSQTALPLPRKEFPAFSVIEGCTAVGYTARTTQRWPGIKGLYQVQCVGMPPYPGARYPRIGGLVTPIRSADKSKAEINYVHGDALNPRGVGNRLILHIVNDRTPNWGGGGFAAMVRKKYPAVQDGFRTWAKQQRNNFSLGNIHVSSTNDSLSIISLIAQRGYGPSPSPRIRYEALNRCLEKVLSIAKLSNASVHMPRIGVGHAGGSWPTIEEIVYTHLVENGISVTVYDLPPRPERTSPDGFLSDSQISPGA